MSRYGLYGAWPRDAYAAPEVQSVTYPVGTANIDVVDAHQKQLIWEGVAEGRITDDAMERPRETIASVVTQLFTKFPGRANIVDNERAEPSASPRREPSASLN